jgi:transmembrane sensor
MKVKENYQNYSAADLLKDEKFLYWLLDPNEDSNELWNEQQKKFPKLKRNIETAIKIFHTMKINQPDLSDEEEAKIFSNIYCKYKRNRIIKKICFYAGSAACLLLVLGLSFWLNRSYNKYYSQHEITAYIPTTHSTVDFNKLKNTEVILYNGKKISIDKNDANISLSNNNILKVKDSKNSYQSQLINHSNYIRLLVPYGKRSCLLLPDGTKLWINSGTEVRFTNSMMGKERQIFVDGEIYIEVAHNPRRPFYVRTSDMNVRVYGTKFNVTSYHSDKIKRVALIEGRISVCSNKVKSNVVMLLPNQEYAQSNNGFSVRKVNATDFMSWKNGLWIFTNEELSSIALRLSRYYGKPIECAANISDKSCTGKLVLFDDVHTTMETIAEILSVRCLSINNKIYIKSK